MLKRKDLKFRLATRHKEFAIIQFAQFMKPTDVVTAVMEQFKTELAADIEKYGAGEIRRYLSHNFWTLNPKNGKMPEKFKELFETHKQLYLNTYTDSYSATPETSSENLTISTKNVPSNLKTPTQTKRGSSCRQCSKLSKPSETLLTQSHSTNLKTKMACLKQ